MRPVWCLPLIAFLLPNVSEADEKPLCVIHSNYLENTRADWKRTVRGGSRILAVTSDGKQVTVTEDNLEKVAVDLASQDPKPKLVAEDMKALGYEVLSKRDYDATKHSGPIVAVTVNDVIGAVPGMGYVFFDKDFVSPGDLQDPETIARVPKIQWSDAMVGAGGGEMTRLYNGPGTVEFAKKLAKLLEESGWKPRVSGPASSGEEVTLRCREAFVTLVHKKVTLEGALQEVSDKTGVPIQLIVEDLQQEGITKNQSFGHDGAHQELPVVLKQILLKADPDDRLVYVVRPVDGGNVVVITTRPAAQRRNEHVMPTLRLVPVKWSSVFGDGIPPVSLEYERDRLETILLDLSDQGGVPIHLSGEDLQQEGITKNQSLGLEVYDRPFHEVLDQILRKANPDGKLVCVVRQVGGKDVLVITTRAAAQRRNEIAMPMR